MTPLISIIIPTYNRAHLIGETLDSVLAQTYQNWECLVVDDGSTDNTEELMAAYIAKDARFQFHHRPKDRLPGGNAARNYGFEMSKGEYVQWFDSDDLMHPEKLAIKIKTILDYKVDFVISQTQYFNRDNFKEYQYNYKEEEVNFLSYSTTHISWFTPDLFLKRNIAEKVSFNENLKAGQEYNFSCKLLLETNSLKKIDKVLTMCRYHDSSIGFERRENNFNYFKSRLEIYWVNYKDVIKITRSNQFEKYTLLVCLSAYFQSGKQGRLPKGFNAAIVKSFGWKTIYYYAAFSTYFLLGKYYFFYLKLKS
ncbi:glycosyltransferase family 2 protein [Aequorivita marina]|uniref:glycosyltransferase family 2 protein n=1 Tax=Aequorivita marina TaxID=3073654 RepID=UPI0028741748|nr:glycosyltransferase family 2 protein [Aequorivita sp. S2608]MDS1298053.1 glycosyltransferase family 2 protein [Aequorivita sp. S2608]